MMPDGWNIQTIEEIAKVTSGGTPRRSVDEFWGGRIPWVTTAEVHSNIITDTVQKITPEGLENSSAKLFPPETILMAMYGQGKTRGQVAKLGIEASTNQACAAILLKEGFFSEFYYLFLQSQYENIRKLSNSGGQQNLSAGLVKSILVPVPPFKEQNKIAKIISAWDKTISITEKLLTNSLQQKKSMEQQLLSGKKRLAGFNEEWRMINFGEVVIETKLGTTERHQGSCVDKSIPLLKMGNLTWGGFTLNSVELLPIDKVEKSLILTSGDFLFNTRNTPELVGKSAVWKGQFLKATFDNNINKIRFRPDIDPDFICAYLTTGKGRSQIRSLPAGSTSVAAIYWKDLKTLKFKIPVLAEQRRIASILSTASLEIDTLKQKIICLKQEKNALMQQLLTGKRRVLIDKDVG